MLLLSVLPSSALLTTLLLLLAVCGGGGGARAEVCPADVIDRVGCTPGEAGDADCDMRFPSSAGRCNPVTRTCAPPPNADGGSISDDALIDDNCLFNATGQDPSLCQIYAGDRANGNCTDKCIASVVYPLNPGNGGAPIPICGVEGSETSLVYNCSCVNPPPPPPTPPPAPTPPPPPTPLPTAADCDAVACLIDQWLGAVNANQVGDFLFPLCAADAEQGSLCRFTWVDGPPTIDADGSIVAPAAEETTFPWCRAGQCLPRAGTPNSPLRCEPTCSYGRAVGAPFNCSALPDPAVDPCAPVTPPPPPSAARKPAAVVVAVVFPLLTLCIAFAACAVLIHRHRLNDRRAAREIQRLRAAQSRSGTARRPPPSTRL